MSTAEQQALTPREQETPGRPSDPADPAGAHLSLGAPDPGLMALPGVLGGGRQGLELPGATLERSGTPGLQAGLLLSLTLYPRPAERPFRFLKVREGYALGRHHTVREAAP